MVAALSRPVVTLLVTTLVPKPDSLMGTHTAVPSPVMPVSA
jgi:hypothetical protein